MSQPEPLEKAHTEALRVTLLGATLLKSQAEAHGNRVVGCTAVTLCGLPWIQGHSGLRARASGLGLTAFAPVATTHATHNDVMVESNYAYTMTSRIAISHVDLSCRFYRCTLHCGLRVLHA